MMNQLQQQALDARGPGSPGTDPVFRGRWSPRAMAGTALTEAQLLPLIEAARWAPSCFNAQPWRFVYSLQGDAHWDTYLDLLMDANRGWACQAGALVMIISRTRFEHNEQPAMTASFDAGAAWMSMALQASMQGLVVHGMAGFDYERARSVANLPEVFKVEAMVAIGEPGDIAALPPAVAEKERPSPRKPLADLMVAGAFVEQAG